jgi:hypothetical protein
MAWEKHAAFRPTLLWGYLITVSSKAMKNWPSEVADATTAYRPVADNWYLFEVHH